MKFLDDQQKEENRRQQSAGASQVSETLHQFDTAKSKFFEERLYPIARDGKLTQDQAMFVADIFQDRTSGAVTADELNQALNLVAPHLKTQDMATVMLFAPRLVLGLDLGSESLHSEAGILTDAEKQKEIQKTISDPNYVSHVPYGKELAAIQAKDIRSKYEAIRSRLGSFRDPNMDSTFESFIAVVANDSMDFKGSDLTLYQMYMNAVGRAVTTAFGQSYGSQAQEDSAVKAANDVAQQIIQQMMSDPNAKAPTPNEIQSMINQQSQAYVESNWSGGGALTLVVLGAAIWYALKGRK